MTTRLAGTDPCCVCGAEEGAEVGRLRRLLGLYQSFRVLGPGECYCPRCWEARTSPSREETDDMAATEEEDQQTSGVSISNRSWYYPHFSSCTSYVSFSVVNSQCTAAWVPAGGIMGGGERIVFSSPPRELVEEIEEEESVLKELSTQRKKRQIWL